MTKEQFLYEYFWSSKQMPHKFITDLDAVIANEIAKVQPQPEEAKPQPALNPIADAYERGEKIRCIKWSKDEWIKKHSESQAITNLGDIFVIVNLINTLEYFTTHPEKWELYKEPTEQSSNQVKLDNSFNKDRFEAMFRVCAIIGNKDGKVPTWKAIFTATEEALTKLDAYYATKEGGGNNG